MPDTQGRTEVIRGGHESEIGWREALLPENPQRLASGFLVSLTLFFLLGLVPAALMRLELIDDTSRLFAGSQFAGLFSTHAMWMIFLVALPALPAVFGNLFLPAMLGTSGWFFRRLATTSFLAYVLAGLCLLVSVFKGSPDATWMLNPSIGEMPSPAGFPWALLGLGLVCISCLAQSINLLATVHHALRRGARRLRLPQLAWGLYWGALLTLVCVPFLLTLVILSGADALGFGRFFRADAGGDPDLYHRLFWLFARPAFYAVLLPMVGLLGFIVERHSAPRQEPDRAVAGAMTALAVLGILGAGGHVSASVPASLSLVFSLLNALSLVPLFLILGSWGRAYWSAPGKFDASLAYAVAAVVTALLGGLSGLLLVALGAGNDLPATVFVVGHLHFILAGSLMSTLLGGLYLGWPLLCDRRYGEPVGVFGAVLLTVGVNLAFLPQFLLGFSGLPRRMAGFPEEFMPMQVLSSAGMTLLMAAYLVPVIHLLWTSRFGERLLDRSGGSAVPPGGAPAFRRTGDSA